MAFTGAFSVLPNPLDPTSFSLADESVGNDPNITQRQISLFLVSGTTLVPTGTTTTYIVWPWPTPSTLPITGLLTQDYSLLIIVNWISSSPLAGSTYTATVLYTFTGNTNTFIYKLIQNIAAQQTLLNDADFLANLGKLQTFLDSAIQAQSFNSQGNAQLMLNFAQNLMQNQNLYFGT